MLSSQQMLIVCVVLAIFVFSQSRDTETMYGANTDVTQCSYTDGHHVRRVHTRYASECANAAQKGLVNSTKPEIFSLYTDSTALQHGEVLPGGKVNISPHIPLSHMETASQMYSMCHYLRDNNLEHTEKHMDQCDGYW
jgi:hypothetical protein